MSANMGPYRLLELIGSGSTASVYRAMKEGSPSELALKVLHPHLCADGGVRERFKREVLAARGLRHPGIAAVYDLVEEGQSLAIAMELCPGGSLEGWKAGGAEALAELGRQAGEALAYAHARGVIHRDVKPSNVLRAADGSYRLCDFGSARVQDMAGLTSSSAFIGTPLFVPPESVLERRPDPRWDIYSLGALLYICATGRPHAETGLAGLYAERSRPPHPSDLAPSLPRRLGDLILSMLGSPESRPRTAEEFLSLLAGRQAPPAPAARCPRCLSPMPARALVCPACRKPLPDLSPRQGSQAYSLILSKLPEDSRVLGTFRSKLRVISGDPAYEPRFTTENVQWYSKEERKRYYSLPCRLVDGVSREGAADLKSVLEISSGSAKVALEVKPSRKRAWGEKEKKGPALVPAARFTKIDDPAARAAVDFELQALAGMEPAGAAAGSSLPAGWDSSALASRLRLGFQDRVSSGSDPASLSRALLDALSAAAALRRRIQSIDAELEQVSLGALYAQRQRLEELIADSAEAGASEELIRDKLEIEEAHERCKRLETERAMLMNRFLSTVAALEALPEGADLEAALTGLEAPG